VNIPIIFLNSRWAAYPEIIENIFDKNKTSCRQLRRILSLSLCRVHQWLAAKNIKSIACFKFGGGGIAFYKTNEIKSNLTELQAQQMEFASISELVDMTGISRERLNKIISKSNVEFIEARPKSGNRIRYYNKNLIFDLLKKEVIQCNHLKFLITA
jgi:hypothetical protein